MRALLHLRRLQGAAALLSRDQLYVPIVCEASASFASPAALGSDLPVVAVPLIQRTQFTSRMAALESQTEEHDEEEVSFDEQLLAGETVLTLPEDLSIIASINEDLYDAMVAHKEHAQ